MLESSKA